MGNAGHVYKVPGGYIARVAGTPEEFNTLDMTFWLTTDMGKSLSKEANGREVTILNSKSSGRFILKRSKKESLWRHLRLFFFGQSPCGGAVREARQRAALSAAGIKTEKAAVYGEVKTGFMQVRGFLLVPMVEGELFEDYWDAASAGEKNALAYKYGELVGRMHAAGFLTALRFKDIVVNARGELVLIDRECSRPGREFFMWKRSVRCIVRGYKRSVRNLFKIQLSVKIAAAFLTGLRRGLGAKKKYYRKIRLALIKSI